MEYRVRAFHDREGVKAITLQALDAGDAATQARRLGYTVLSAQPVHTLRPRLHRRFPLALFTQELVALLGAGLTLVESLETLLEKEQGTDVRLVMMRVIDRVREGQPLSRALTQAGPHFPPLYIATVSAAERTGDLREALSRYLAYHGEIDRLRKKIISASIYPVLLIVAGALAIVFLALYVVPRFAHVYADVQAELPLASRLLLEWGRLIDEHGGLLGAAAAAIVGAAAFALSRESTRRHWRALVTRIASRSRRLRALQLARFYRTLGMLLRGGTPVLNAFEMAAGLLSAPLRAHVSLASADVRAGQALSRALERHQLTTPVAARMLRVGERSGQMGEMMERIAGFYDEEISRWVDWTIRLVEPLLMAFIGFVIGLIVLLMYFPIFELAGSLQ